MGPTTKSTVNGTSNLLLLQNTSRCNNKSCALGALFLVFSTLSPPYTHSDTKFFLHNFAFLGTWDKFEVKDQSSSPVQ